MIYDGGIGYLYDLLIHYSARVLVLVLASHVVEAKAGADAQCRSSKSLFREKTTSKEAQS
jgi:hypothetical protein